ncbi:MAG: ribonuclease PH [Candidatus Melainabacteria bacterium]|nr:ribonuclease PH [Candidatus Melainabacteria bacterium]
MFERPDQRQPGELRPIRLTRQYTRFAPGSVLVAYGATQVLVTATVEDRVPRHIHQQQKEQKDENLGWLTAEYSMLPGATQTRNSRDRLKVSGRTMEIQRLIGRTLRTCVDLTRLGSRTITIDADVLQADGGTRVAAVTGAYVALVDALHSLKKQGDLSEIPLKFALAAVSVGIVQGTVLLDLNYEEDSAADVDSNIVMNDRGEIVEWQSSTESTPFHRDTMMHMLNMAESGIQQLLSLQQQALAEPEATVLAV